MSLKFEETYGFFTNFKHQNELFLPVNEARIAMILPLNTPQSSWASSKTTSLKRILGFHVILQKSVKSVSFTSSPSRFVLSLDQS